ncbi:hypothetical protein ACIBH1_10765 [Nonomuraea sp. NPDC050663]
MTWIYVGVGAAGLLVLAVLGIRVLVAARGLNRQIAAAHETFGTERPSEG